jgi:D-alanine-D-alanine ligase-like ATP-grasp enzyme
MDPGSEYDSGMTETSLLPMAAKARGISFPELCEIILQDASLKKS